MNEFKSHKDERLFKGTAKEYLLLRAKKHRKNYNDEKQAQVLEQLAESIYTKEQVIELMSDAYRVGHQDTVDGNASWCKEGIKEICKDIIEEYV